MAVVVVFLSKMELPDREHVLDAWIDHAVESTYLVTGGARTMLEPRIYPMTTDV